MLESFLVTSASVVVDTTSGIIEDANNLVSYCNLGLTTRHITAKHNVTSVIVEGTTIRIVAIVDNTVEKQDAFEGSDTARIVEVVDCTSFEEDIRGAEVARPCSLVVGLWEHYFHCLQSPILPLDPSFSPLLHVVM